MKKSPVKLAAADGWGPWRCTIRSVKISTAMLEETLRGGQAFRWHRVKGGEDEAAVWQGVWGECVARVRADSEGMMEWTCPVALANTVAPEVEDYFATEVDFEKLSDDLPWRTDAGLAERMQRWRGLRLLRQPLGETLLAFICSSAKQIPHIAQICEKMAARFGETIWADVHALPSWPRLAENDEKDLRACGLGYRAAFIHQTARRLQQEPHWESKIKNADYAEAHAWLAELPGVGPKIADCVLLFGAAKYEAFPVDTWILQAMAERYELRGWRPAQVAQFGRAHFGPLAGLAQQYLFSGARKEKK
ncbi:MAG TPA: DNA glycosylase [Opitutales bacterium]|nr:DNA glycosylase [Opitutales bacterium]